MTSLNSYFEAYEKPTSHMFEKEENKQHYNYIIEEYEHDKPKRHLLGLVGGNDTYEIKGNRMDLESDLLGITRPFTWGNSRKHQPPKDLNEIKRENPKNLLYFNQVSN